jgi:CRISPR-associated protein Cas2
MKRHKFLICYDIADAKRLRHVAKICESFGNRIQFSVFESSLSPTMLATLQSQLDEIINHTNDQIMFVNLGADDESTPFSIQTLGLPYVKKNRITII